MNVSNVALKTLGTAVDDTNEVFQEHYYLTRVGPNLWRAYNRKTGESASPVYNSREAAINFVVCEMKAELEEAIDAVLREPRVD